MGDATESLQSLILSANEIADMTSWPDELIEDYLNIFRNLVNVSNVVDTDFIHLRQETSNLSAFVGKLKAKTSLLIASLEKADQTINYLSNNKLKSQVESLKTKIEQLEQKVNLSNSNKNKSKIESVNLKVKNLEQLANAW